MIKLPSPHQSHPSPPSQPSWLLSAFWPQLLHSHPSFLLQNASNASNVLSALNAWNASNRDSSQNRHFNLRSKCLLTYLPLSPVSIPFCLLQQRACPPVRCLSFHPTFLSSKYCLLQFQEHQGLSTSTRDSSGFCLASYMDKSFLRHLSSQLLSRHH